MASQSKILICYGFCSNREEIPRKKTDKPALGIVQMAKTVEKEEELVNQCFTTKAKIEPPQELTSLDEATQSDQGLVYLPDDNKMIASKFTEYFTFKLAKDFVNFRLYHVDKSQFKVDPV